MGEEFREQVLKKYNIPQRYIDIYFYILYKDPIYLPSDLKKDNKTRPVKKCELNKEVTNLCILLARSILESEVI